jgi:hypothetical protein
VSRASPGRTPHLFTRETWSEGLRRRSCCALPRPAANDRALRQSRLRIFPSWLPPENDHAVRVLAHAERRSVNSGSDPKNFLVRWRTGGERSRLLRDRSSSRPCCHCSSRHCTCSFQLGAYLIDAADHRNVAVDEIDLRHARDLRMRHDADPCPAAVDYVSDGQALVSQGRNLWRWSKFQCRLVGIQEVLHADTNRF